MIISASRRTDIPAFFADWFINRIEEGFCTVPNPFNAKQISEVSLRKHDVDAIVFWTKNPSPLLKSLSKLDEKGYKYYFQFSLTLYAKDLEPKVPSIEKRIETFLALSSKIGPERVIWRYDPIVISKMADVGFHEFNFMEIADKLAGSTRRVVISIVDMYKKTLRKMAKLKDATINLNSHPESIDGFGDMIRSIASCANRNGMEIYSCAEDVDLENYGVAPGKCIDDELIERLFDLNLSVGKDRFQREACGCVASKDIGMYNTCPYNCTYCYANSSLGTIHENRRG